MNNYSMDDVDVSLNKEVGLTDLQIYGINASVVGF